MIRTSTYGPVTRFDIARTLFGRGRYWTTAYLVDGLLIDSGCAHEAAGILSALHPQPPTRLVNTHSHEDHIGANGLLQGHFPGMLVQAHPAALPVLADPLALQPLHPSRRLFWGAPAPCLAQPLADGDLIPTPNFTFQGERFDANLETEQFLDVGHRVAKAAGVLYTTLTGRSMKYYSR